MDISTAAAAQSVRRNRTIDVGEPTGCAAPLHYQLE